METIKQLCGPDAVLVRELSSGVFSLDDGVTPIPLAAAVLPLGDLFGSIQFNNAGALAGSPFTYQAPLGVTPAPTLSVHGTPGTTHYSYTIAWRTKIGLALSSSVVTITNGPATLDTNNWIVVTPPLAPLGVLSYDVFRTASAGTPSTTGCIAGLGESSTTVPAGTAFNDKGGAADQFVYGSLLDLSGGYNTPLNAVPVTFGDGGVYGFGSSFGLEIGFTDTSQLSINLIGFSGFAVDYRVNSTVVNSTWNPSAPFGGEYVDTVTSQLWLPDSYSGWHSIDILDAVHWGSVVGVLGSAHYDGSGSVAAMNGVLGQTYVNTTGFPIGSTSAVGAYVNISHPADVKEACGYSMDGNGFGQDGLGLKISNVTGINNAYGIKILDVVGATNNWAIKTGVGHVSFGDRVDAPSVVTNALTVATLPVSPVAGQRSFVTDSNAVSFTAGIGAVVAAGGSTKVPVVYDGTSWRIG